MGKRVKNGLKTAKSLNIILWFCFSLFAIIIVLMFVVVQNALVDSRYRAESIERLKSAGNEVQAEIELEVNSRTAMQKLYDVCRRYGVSGYLINEDGKSLFPEITGQKSYPVLVETLKKQFSDGRKTVTFSDGDELIYAIDTSLEGQSCYLCMISTLQTLRDFEKGLSYISVITAAVAVVLAFVASAFVAVLVTKPVSEVTERAKQLARGNYEQDFKQQYFCREINELSEALDCARAGMFKADKMQKELIANVSHDFKTPLTMIKAYASMIREISGDDKRKRDEHAKIIIDESDRLATLVEDILDLSKIQAAAGTVERTVFNLSEEVYRIVNRFDFLQTTDGYTLETEVEDDLYIFANRDRIGQVFYNLINNAVNYTGADKKVRIRLYKTGNMSRFEVIDSGKGIKPEEISTIWDRYYRASEAHQRPVQGTGLGLSIVKGVLEAHGYPYGVESEVGKGSCFWVEFSAPPADAKAEEKAKSASKSTETETRHEA